MRIIEASEVIKILEMDKCIPLMKQALIDLESGKSVQPPRTIHHLPHETAFGFMPAYLDGEYFGAKIISACHINIGTSYPSHTGYVILFESEHGIPVAMVDATSITQIRTGAVSGVATDLLSRKDASSLAIIGAGAQAKSHLAAMLCVRNISNVRVYDIRTEAAERFQEEASKKYNLDITIMPDVQSTVHNADIICTLTPSKDAFLESGWVKLGTHINAVGTFTPMTREVTSELVACSRLYADQVTAMKKESGEYLIPLSEGFITENHIIGSIGDLAVGKIAGRISDKDVTLFIALGLAVEDVVSAKYVYDTVVRG
jgi:ornithine cyclodeaminase/alanine dehydrogenase-like protein (mu-crystallin family)